MPASALKGVQRRPVGIRSLPINDGKKNRLTVLEISHRIYFYRHDFDFHISGPRTGEGVYPGEIVEVSIKFPLHISSRIVIPFFHPIFVGGANLGAASGHACVGAALPPPLR